VCLYFYAGDGKTNDFFFIFMYLVNYIQVVWTYIKRQKVLWLCIVGICVLLYSRVRQRMVIQTVMKDTVFVEWKPSSDPVLSHFSPLHILCLQDLT